jgi:hypothetical protein
LDQQGVYFGTRQKSQAQVKVPARCAVERSTGLIADHDGVLTGANGRAYPAGLRQVR